ncbi:MAG: Mut7-C ubiquitin/RNAse domain-containing protein [Candidatus Marinimicrobia bacterium]|nr:Mut7-C ubiquitin/RNAse domain-containing protein [Candidatus Neomarinimicrobiota bacterium]
MIQVFLRFYEELNDLLPLPYRKVEFRKDLLLPTTVKDLIESCRVPHTEVDLILVNGDSVDFQYLVRHNDHISVYPVFESMDISGVTRLQDRPLRELRFITDRPLGKLTGRLRLLGQDVEYGLNFSGMELVDKAVNSGRILLTRNRQLLMPSRIKRGYLVRSNYPKDQVVEVLHRFDLLGSIKPFTRCMNCNGILIPVKKEDILHLLEPLTKRYYRRFRQCDSCGQVYWKGSHHEKLKKYISNLISDLA